jgi:tetratricopeptide (TPR) repeat protein
MKRLRWCCALFAAATTIALMPVRAQSPQTRSAAIIQLLESYGGGLYPSFKVASLGQFRSDLQNVGKPWVLAGGEADRERRRQVVALAALDGAIIAGPNDWGTARQLLEWGCAYLREGTPTAFEREWLRLSIALSQLQLDELYLVDDHVKHADARFPQDPEFAAAKIFSRYELNRLTRRPFRSAVELMRASVSSSPIPGITLDFSQGAATQRVRDTITQLERLARESTQRPRAVLRLGVLEYELGEIAASRGHLTAALDSSTDAFDRYLAYLVIGLGFDVERRPADAAGAFANAVSVDPALQSGALQLAAHYQLLGRPDDASAVLDAAFRSQSTIDDPWQYPCAHCNGWNRRIAAVHAMVRR